MTDNPLMLAQDRATNQLAERKTGLKLALDAGALHTFSAIKDPNACYEDILKVAINELGVDKFIPFILNNDPFWAYNTLRFVPNLGNYRDTLIKKAAETPESALHTLRFISDLGDHQGLLQDKAGALAQPLGAISGFNLLDQGGYNCAFTMYWSNAGETQPKKGTPDKSSWKWSDTIMLGQSTSALCAQFELPKSPLAPGNEVWMYLWVQAGKDIESPLHFTYDPNTSNKAYFTCSGTTTIDHLGFNGIQS